MRTESQGDGDDFSLFHHCKRLIIPLKASTDINWSILMMVILSADIEQA